MFFKELLENPEQVTAIRRGDSEPFLYLVPPSQYLKKENPSRLEKLERRKASLEPGQLKPFADRIEEAVQRTLT